MLAIFLFFLVSRVSSQTLNNTVEPGWNTECKTCPYKLCPNARYYGTGYGTAALTLTCWTRGTSIDGDSTWLKTTDGCYVTQYDLVEYAGEYQRDIPYCGQASETELYTKQAAQLKYNTECNIGPHLSNDNVHYHKYGTRLTITCYTESDVIINDTTWLKTTSNCYIAQIGLTHPANLATLNNCGPIPFLYVNYTVPDVTEDHSVSPSKVEKTNVDEHKLNKRHLFSSLIGEEYALCYSNPKLSSSVQRRYHFKQEVWVQCLVVDPDAGANETYWSLSTDFCYVRSVDLWDQPQENSNRFPLCEWFV